MAVKSPHAAVAAEDLKRTARPRGVKPWLASGISFSELRGQAQKIFYLNFEIF
jgi:hypothetical protein